MGFDTSLGLAVATAQEWVGLQIGRFDSYIPFFGLTIGPSSISSFDGITNPPWPPSLAPGTYNIGTIVWDTSGAQAGTHRISTFIDPIDGSAAVRPAGSGNIVFTTGTEVPATGSIDIVPEPSTGALLGLSLLGVGFTARCRAMRRAPAERLRGAASNRQARLGGRRHPPVRLRGTRAG